MKKLNTDNIINDLINSISKSIKNKLPTYNIYLEDIKQGLKTPCFIIKMLAYEYSIGMNNEQFFRSIEDISIEIIMLPKDDNEQQLQLKDITKQLIKILNNIYLYDKLIHVNNLKTIFVDNNINVTFDVTINMLNKIINVKMDKLIEKGNIKHGN